MKAWLTPDHYERRYSRFLQKTLTEVRKEFLIRLGAIIKYPGYENIKQDVYYIDAKRTLEKDSDEITILIAAMFLWWQYKKQTLMSNFRGYYLLVNLFNDNQFRLVIKDLSKLTIAKTRLAPMDFTLQTSQNSVIQNIFGETADVYRNEPYLQGVENNFLATQATYIDKSVSLAIRDSELIVRNSLVTAAKATNTISNILKRFGVLENYASLFGKNQISKLDAQLTKNRQQSFNGTTYKWDTQHDERVRGNPNGLYPNARPSHYARDGQIFSWDNPPEGGAPGEADGCRCVAVMRLPK